MCCVYGGEKHYAGNRANEKIGMGFINLTESHTHTQKIERLNSWFTLITEKNLDSCADILVLCYVYA